MSKAIAEIAKRMTSLEREFVEFRRQLRYEQELQAIRESLESVERGEGRPARTVLNEIRRKYRIPAK